MQIKVIASGSSGNAYRVSDGNTALLLDAGVTVKQLREALNFRLRDIKGCLITHSHGDHSKGAKGLIDAGINVYTSAGTIDACKLTGRWVCKIRAHEKILIGTFTVLPFDVQHDAPEPLGFLLTSNVTGERLLYFTDTYYLKYRFEGLTHIMGECNYSSEALKESVDAGYIPPELVPRLYKSHMNLEHFVDLLKANDLSKLRQVWLLHLSAKNSRPEEFREVVRAVTGCEVYIC